MNRTVRMRLEPQQRLYKIGRMMDKLWFRFHTAHARSVRITIKDQSIRLETGGVG